MVRVLIAIVSVFWLSGLAWGENENWELAGIRQVLRTMLRERQYKEALPLAERMLKVVQDRHLETPEGAEAWQAMATIYFWLGEYARAVPYEERAIEIWEKATPAEPEKLARELESLAIIYLRSGDFAKALPLEERAAKLRRETLGPKHPQVAAALRLLGKLRVEVGQLAEARQALASALAIETELYGANDARLADSLVALGNVLRIQADYVNAEEMYRQGLVLLARRDGEESKSVAQVAEYQAMLYRELADYAKARTFAERAVALDEKLLGAESPTTLGAVATLATIEERAGRFSEAVELKQRVLAQREKTLGPEHPRTIEMLNQMAMTCSAMGNPALALPYLERAVAAIEKTRGADEVALAGPVFTLGLLYEQIGQYKAAEKFYLRAWPAIEKTYGPNHPETAKVYFSLANAYLQDREDAVALDYARRGLARQEAHLREVFQLAEAQRLSLHQDMEPYTIFGSCLSADDMAQAVLRHKGLVLDSLLEDRRIARASKKPEVAQTIEELRLAKQRYAEAMLGRPDGARQKEIDARLDEVQRLESRLAQAAGFARPALAALDVTVPQVKAVLAPGQVLVEFIRFRELNGHHQGQEDYGAVVTTRGDGPSFVALSAAAKVDVLMAKYRSAMTPEAVEKEGGKLPELLHALYDAVWARLAGILPDDATTIIISPDSDLNFLSFATLLTPMDRFLAEDYSIRYVTSGRDLLEKSGAGPNRLMAAFGSPDLACDVAAPAGRGIAPPMPAPARLTLKQILQGGLPGALRECETLRDLAAESDDPAQLFLGQDATEARLRALPAPRVLHLATHGYFLPDSDKSKLPGGTLFRSGLLLAGATRTFAAWEQNQVPPPDNDGFLTADEVSELNLENTWLVTLSACESGLGEAHAGEGVMGLRRGFLYAGAQNLVSTLWAVNDLASASFMADFYRLALRSGNASGALAVTQAVWLREARARLGLARAVLLAGPFILTARGPQK